MPQSALKSKHTGRPKGSRNKATIQREAEVARQLDDARNHGKPLAKDRLDDLLDVAMGAMSFFQPVSEEAAQKARAAGNLRAKAQAGDWPQFGAWWDRATHASKELAKYQSPQFRAIAVMAPAPQPTQQQIEADNVVRLDDPVAIARVYQRRIQGGR